MSTQNDSFTKRSGTTDKGKDYEDLILANLSLRYLQNATAPFYLCSNHPEFGAFDDIVVEAEANYALQLKHVTNPDRGSLRNKLTSSEGNFSIQKYYQDYTKYGKPSYNFILYTNHKFDIEDDATLTLSNQVVVKVIKVKQKVFKFSESEGNCFRFEVVDNRNEYGKFFDHFVLYTNQASVEEVKLQTLKMFQEMFSCGGEQYLQFITEWSKSEGKKKKLNRGFLEEAIAILVLGPVTRPFVFRKGGSTEKIHLFRSLLSDFDVTFLKSGSDSIQSIWDDLDLPELESVNRTGLEYKIILERVKSTSDLDDITRSKLLWLFKKHPLIVEAGESTTKAVNLCQKRKYIILGDILPKLSTPVLHNLGDLDQGSEKYKQMLQLFTCLLKDNKELTLGELLESHPKIEAVLTTTELLQMATNSLKMSHIITLLALADPEISKMCEEGYTPLHVACIKGNLPLTELITSSDINLNGASKDGDSPIFLATVHGHYKIVETLLKCGADPNSANKNGDTAIQVACSNGDYALARLLGEAKANVDAADKRGVTALQVAAAQGNVRIVELLVELGADVNRSNEFGETALYSACIKGHHDVVGALVGAKAKQISNMFGNAPLHAASMKGHHKCVRTLLERSSQEIIDEEDIDENEKMMRELFSVRKNCSNVKGDTPLHMACEKGFLEVVEVLKEFGTDCEVRNAQGLTPGELARQKGQLHVAAYLSA